MRNQKQSRPKKSSLVIGPDAVIEALQTGEALDKIYLDSKPTNPKYRGAFAEIRRLALKDSIPIQFVPRAKIDGFNITNHEGVVAQRSKVQYYELQDIILQTIEKGETPLFLILDGITDIRNIGGIARTAYCSGVHAIIIPLKGIGALNEDAILTSAGALEKIPVCRVNSLMKAVDELHLNGIVVMASEMTAPVSIYNCDFSVPCAIIMGSEDKGIYPALQKIADSSFHIPMKGDFESLNVSVATGMILYEVVRQRAKEL